jgi:hypothetical protein
MEWRGTEWVACNRRVPRPSTIVDVIWITPDPPTILKRIASGVFFAG